MNFSKVLRTFLASTALGFMALNTQAALFGDDEARKAILDLRQKVDAQQQRNTEDLRKTNDDNAQLRRSILELSNQMETLRADLAKLRGQDEQLARQDEQLARQVEQLARQVEQLAREVAEMQRRQKDIAQGLDDRLRKFEPSKVTVDGKEFVASPAEIHDFDAALTTLRKGEFAPAQTAFLEFFKRYPETDYRPSALFWLANAQYALRYYREAITNFKSVIGVAPDHLRAPEAALSIANCQIELKDTVSARKTLTDLIRVYPQSEAASVAKDRLTKLK